MVTTINPYLSFDSNARAAMEYYQSLFGGTLDVLTFESFGMGGEGEGDKVMHAYLETPDGLALMASDTPNEMGHTPPVGMSVALSGDDEQKLRGFWEGLIDGGSVTEPLDSPPWGGLFGMCVDRFGIAWMVSISPQRATQAGTAVN
jgi:PhnB protein